MQKCYAAAVLYMVATLSALLFMPVAAIADDNLTFSQLRNLIKTGKAGQIQKVVVTNGQSRIQVQMAGNDRTQNVTVPTEMKEKLLASLDDAGVTLDVHDVDQSGYWFSMISSFFLPILLLVGFLSMFRAAQSPSTRRYKFEPDIKAE